MVLVCHGRIDKALARKESRGQRCSGFPRRELSTVANRSIISLVLLQ
jgi:hypothetical protein